MTVEMYPRESEGFLYPEVTQLAPEGAETDFQTYHTVRGIVEVHGATTTYNLNVPTDPDTLVITAFKNGFGAFKKTMRGIGNATAQQGTPSLWYAPIRGSERSMRQDLSDATGVHVDTMRAILDDLASNPQLQDVPNGDQINMNKVNLAPHSYGGASAVRFALRHPEDVDNIVFIQAVGLENPQMHRFFGRLPAFFKHELTPFLASHGPEFSVWDARRAIKHFIADPCQTMGEMLACLTTDNRPHLPTLRQHGIGTAILTGTRDNLIPAAPIESIARHMVDHYEKLDTDHLGPQREPQKLAQAVIRSVVTLEAMKLAPQPQLTIVPGQRTDS